MTVISSNTKTIQKFTFFSIAIYAVIYISRIIIFSNNEVKLSENTTCNIRSPHPIIIGENTFSEIAYKGQD